MPLGRSGDRAQLLHERGRDVVVVGEAVEHLVDAVVRLRVLGDELGQRPVPPGALGLRQRAVRHSRVSSLRNRYSSTSSSSRSLSARRSSGAVGVGVATGLRERPHELERPGVADDRRVLEHHAVLRVEPVEAGREQAVQGGGELAGALGAARRLLEHRHELFDEERVAAAALAQGRQRARGRRPGAARAGAGRCRRSRAGRGSRAPCCDGPRAVTTGRSAPAGSCPPRPPARSRRA